jgi:hypothetical protein
MSYSVSASDGTTHTHKREDTAMSVLTPIPAAFGLLVLLAFAFVVYAFIREA